MATTTETIEGLYVAFYHRAADQEGLNYWLTRAEESDGDYIYDLANLFAQHSQFEKEYGDLNDEEFVKAIYQNVLNGVDEDPTAIEYWTGRIDEVGRDGMVAEFVKVVLEYNGNDADGIARKEFFTNRVEVAKDFTETLADDSNPKDISNLEEDRAYVASQIAIESVVDQKSKESMMKFINNHQTLEDWEEELGSLDKYHALHFGKEDKQEHNQQDVSIDKGTNMGHEDMSSNGMSNSANHTQSTEDKEDVGHFGKENSEVEHKLELSNEEIESLIFMYQEEKLAGDVYEALFKMYDVDVFGNIAKSEDKHQASIGNLLENADVDMTSLESLDTGVYENSELQSLYDTLLADGSKSLDAALSVGVLVEKTDIEDLQTYLEDDQLAPEIVEVYEHLLSGSMSHLDAFESYQVEDMPVGI